MKSILAGRRAVVALTVVVGVLCSCGDSDLGVNEQSNTPSPTPRKAPTESDLVCAFAQVKVAELQGATGFDSFVLYLGRAGDSSVWQTSEGHTLVVGNEIVEHFNVSYDDGAPSDELVAAVDAIASEETELRILYPSDGLEPWDCEVREPSFTDVDLVEELRRAG